MLDARRLRGLIAATVTPMQRDGSIDGPGLAPYFGWLAGSGVAGLAINVDTGEGPTLSASERRDVLAEAVAARTDGIVIVAGIGGPSTNQAVDAARDAAAVGADALLVFPNQAFNAMPIGVGSMVTYHRAIADASGLPLLLFQLQPALGGYLLPDEALRALFELESVIGIKEASFDARELMRVRRTVREVKPDAVLLTGNDNFMAESFVLGAQGALLGFGTLLPEWQVRMIDAIQRQETELAGELAAPLQELADAIFEPPVSEYRARLKVALTVQGHLDGAYVRRPLVECEAPEVARVEAALERAVSALQAVVRSEVLTP